MELLNVLITQEEIDKKSLICRNVAPAIRRQNDAPTVIIFYNSNRMKSADRTQ